MILATILGVIGWIIAILLGLPLLVFAVETLIGLFPSRAVPASADAGRAAVLIPAHNEALGLADTLTALRAVAPHDARILVVADNCSDDTAAIARAHGAEVAERSDAVHRGKGYALAFGRDYLADPAHGPAPDVVIVLDADCRLSQGSVAALATACMDRPESPAQAINLIAPTPQAPPMIQIASFAMVVKNLFRSRGMQRLGGVALLTGTGMAFRWPVFAAAHLATGSIVEDLGLGIALTRMGHTPRLIADAHVRSAPPPADVALVQKTRWEHGFLQTVTRAALPLFAESVRTLSRPAFFLALHLMVPPLALLLMLAMAGLVALAAFSLAGATALPLLLLGGLTMAALVMVLCAWMSGGRDWLSGSALLRAPAYILWKIPIYLGFVRRRTVDWQRTRRDGET